MPDTPVEPLDGPIDPRFKNTMNAIAEVLEVALPGLGFTLLVFEFNKAGRSNYLSNAEREDMVESMRAFVAIEDSKKATKQ